MLLLVIQDLSVLDEHKKAADFSVAFRAVGEIRTHTGQRPLPPQSSVSTISPLPQL